MGMKIFFSQTTNQSRPRTDSLGKSNKGQILDQNINELKTYCLDFGCACNQNESSVSQEVSPF